MTSEGFLKSLHYAVLSDVGRRREENQDSFGVLEGSALKAFIVADGMGGARGGAIASGLAVEIIKTSLRGRNSLTTADISASVEQANRSINERGSNDPSLAGMGTTVVGLIFFQNLSFAFSVGDSRLYRLRGGAVKQCNEDHTLVNELVKSGAINLDQAKNHPVAHMLTRSLGPSREVRVDVWTLAEPVQSGDRYLMCSDGLYNLVGDDEIGQLGMNSNLELAVKNLVDLANERGGTDNVTVMLVDAGTPKEIEVTAPLEDAGAMPVPPLPDEAPSMTTEAVLVPSEPQGAMVEPEAGVGASPDFSSTASGIRHKDLRPPLKPLPNWLGILAFAVIIGVLSTGSLLLIQKGGEQIPYPVPEVPTIVAPESSSDIVLPTVKPLDPLLPVEAPTAGPTEAPLLEQGLEALGRKRLEIQDDLGRSEKNLESYEVPSTQLESRINRAREEHRQAENEVVTVTQEIEKAKNKLTASAEQAAKIRVLEPLKAAAELASEAPSIVSLREQFEKSTAEYLDHVAKLKLDPTNTKLSSEMQAKLDQRKSTLQALQKGIEEFLNGNVEFLRTQLSEAERKLPLAQERAQALNAELTLFKHFKDNGPEARAQEKKELELHIQQLKSDLAQLGSTSSN